MLLSAGIAAGLAFPVGRAGAGAPGQPAARPVDPDAFRLLIRIAVTNGAVGLQLLVGVVSLGVAALVQLFLTGFSVAHLAMRALAVGVAPNQLLALTVPHTIFEFPGFVLLSSLQFEAAGVVYHKLRWDSLGFAAGYRRAVVRRIALGFGLIGVAAVVEVFVTGTLATRLTP
ncbi:MAG TPA: stage II sporulation protein M [Longimicrobiales bacterium]